MDPPGNADEDMNGPAMRPTTLSILLGSSLLSPMDSSFRTPSVSELTPSVRSALEEFLQSWRLSPQPPSNFLSPQDTSEDGERFANNLIQKLFELKDSNCVNPTSIRSAALPTSSGTDDLNLADISTPTLYDFANACRQVSAAAAAAQQQQQQQKNVPNTQILLCSPTALTTQSLTDALSKVSNGGTSSDAANSITLDTSSLGCDLKSFQTALRNSLSINLPGKDLSTLQICSGQPAAQYALTGTTTTTTALTNTSNSSLSQPSVLKLEQVVAELSSTLGGADVSQSLTESFLLPLLIQTSMANEHAAAVAAQLEARSGTGHLSSSPRDEHDTTMSSSVGNGQTDPGNELSLLDRAQFPTTTTTCTVTFRSSSPVSSNSSLSQSHGADQSGRELRLDPTEQVRMRLERKRARNRDAARKCRERKIGLIKRLEKEVSHLSEENKHLRTRLCNSRREVERLKLFVINHLHNECPAVANKLA